MVRKLYLTPSTIPASVITRCVRVPASQDWLAVYNRALLLLADPPQWEQREVTDLTPEEAAAVAFEIYTDWLSGSCSMDCEDVITCIQPLIADLVRQGTYNVNHVDASDTTVIEQRFPTAQRNVAILPPPAGCSNDELWAGILEIVTRIDANGRDFWETIEAITDTIERIGEIIALVPLMGDIIGESLQLLADIAPTMYTKYIAYSTQEVIEGIACDLFQLVCSECRYPTYQEVVDYITGNSELGAQRWEDIGWQALIDILIGTDTASNAIVYFTTNAIQCWVLGALATWIRTAGVKFLALWAGIGAADPSDAWELICGACTGAVSPCEETIPQLTALFGSTREQIGENECLMHCTSGPQQGDGDFYIGFETVSSSSQPFSLDLSNASGLSLVNCRWDLGEDGPHYTNLDGLQAVAAMDQFYIRSNTAFTIDIQFTDE
jgi:hypothetical protein